VPPAAVTAERHSETSAQRAGARTAYLSARTKITVSTEKGLEHASLCDLCDLCARLFFPNVDRRIIPFDFRTGRYLCFTVLDIIILFT
jgi:hypothetical protein